MTSEDPTDALLREAKGHPLPMPSSDLVSRVLADAATFMPEPIVGAAPKLSLWARVLAPIGGMGGAATLAACATFGVLAGAGYADEMLAIPGLNSVLAGLIDTTDSTTPFESLSFLMSES